MKIIGMIPARLGSKRVKKKNLRLIDNKPLISYVIEKAKACNLLNDIYLNSDGTIFEEIADKHNINFYHRNKNLASKHSTNDEFSLDFMNNIKGDILIQVLPTSPLITVIEISNFVNEIISKDYDTLISVEHKQIASVYKDKPICHHHH